MYLEHPPTKKSSIAQGLAGMTPPREGQKHPRQPIQPGLGFTPIRSPELKKVKTEQVPPHSTRARVVKGCFR